MAGEVRGKVYEAITKVALEQAIKGNKKGWKVLWHEQPDWISIEADLAIGKDKNSIEALILISHSRSEKLSEKKFWRNVGEVFQWKVQGQKPVRTVSVIFDASVKPGLATAEKQLLDGILVLQEVDYGINLISYIKGHEKNFGVSDQARATFAERLCDPVDSAYDSEFAEWLADFSKALKGLLKSQRIGLEKAWEKLKLIHDHPVSCPNARKMYVRNGIAKLMICEADLRSRIYDAVAGNGELSDDPVPSYALTLDLLSEGVAAADVEDTEIISAVKTIGRDDCERIITRAPARMQDFILPLRAADNINVYSQFVVDHFDELRTADGMADYLLQCFDDPISILPDDAELDVEPRDLWLFVYCMTLEKALEGKIVAYGLSNLAHESGVPDAELRFEMPEFVARNRKPLPSTLDAIARVFAEKIDATGKAKLGSTGFTVSMKAMLIQRQRYVLSTYRNFDPLAWLIEEKLKDAGLIAKQVTVPSFLKERAGVSSATSVYLKGGSDTLIYSQSVTDAGRIHKTKELSARFRATKLQWDGKTFSQRSSARRMYFVADGEWRNGDLEMFLRSGIDAVFFPDEIDKLAGAIKAGSVNGGGGSTPDAKLYRCA
jgi:hypothetical protein